MLVEEEVLVEVMDDLQILDSGEDSGGDEDATPQDSDQDLYDRQHRKPHGDPDSSEDDGGKARRYRAQTPITINKWAKPLPKLDLPPRVHLQKANKVKQIWSECGIGYVHVE